MKSKKVFYIISIGISVAIIYLSFNLFFNYSKAALPRANNDIVNLAKISIIYDISTMLQKNYWYNNKPFNYKLTDVYDTKVAVSKLASAKPKLVLCYSELNCNICVDSALLYFNSFASSVSLNNTILLVEYNTPNYLSRFVRLNNIKTDNIYRIFSEPESPLANDQPFLFILDSDMRMKDVFYPLKEYPELSAMYYTTIKKKYFK